MKLFAFIFGAIMANPMMTWLMMDKLSEGQSLKNQKNSELFKQYFKII